MEKFRPVAVSVGSDVFVGRAKFKGELVPGKVATGHAGCFVAMGGKEHMIKDYEVLCDSGIHCYGQGYCWKRVQNADLPKFALMAGHAHSDPYYVARALVNGEWCAGKAFPPHNCAYFSWGGLEYKLFDYDVLIFNQY